MKRSRVRAQLGKWEGYGGREGGRKGGRGGRKRRAQDKDKCKELLIYLSDSCRFPRMRKHLWGVLNKHTLVPHLIKRGTNTGGGQDFEKGQPDLCTLTCNKPAVQQGLM